NHLWVFYFFLNKPKKPLKILKTKTFFLSFCYKICKYVIFLLH
ncbi:unnamed protein product, partial [Staurois parvus]